MIFFFKKKKSPMTMFGLIDLIENRKRKEMEKKKKRRIEKNWKRIYDFLLFGSKRK